MARRPVLAMVAWAALATVGLALGAETQRETHLAPQDIQDLGQRDTAAAGNVVLLTGLLVAAGVTGAVATMGDPRRQPGAVALLAVGTYVVANLAQTAYPNLIGLQTDELRSGRLTINLFAFNADGLPSVFVPILAMLAGGLLCMGLGARRLLAPPGRGRHDALTLLGRQCAALSLALPFLAVTAWSLVRLLMVPGVAHGMTAVLLSLGALACLGFVATGVWKAAHLAAAVRDGRLAPVAREAWVGLGRAEQVLALVVLLVACAGALLPRTPLDILHPGLTFGLDLRTHAVAVATVLVPLAPLLLLQPRVVSDLAQRPAPGGNAWPLLASLCGAVAVVLAGAAFATFGADGALWAWNVALAGACLAALPALPNRHAAVTVLLAGFAVWATGNSHSAVFEASQGTNLAYDGTAPGGLALLRVAGALLAGLAVAGAVRGLAPGGQASATIPLATAVAFAVVGIALLEFPFDIWVETDHRGESAAMGSLVASQAGAVRATMHLVSLGLACAMVWCVARLARPGWWGRPPSARTAPGPAPAEGAGQRAGRRATPSG